MADNIPVNEGLSATNLTVPEVYEEIFYNNYRYFILSSGRISGKTSILVAKWWQVRNQYPDRDIVILQATATEIKDSIINEIKKFIENSELSDQYEIPESARHIKHKDSLGITYFYPITDSRGGQRTRGIATENKIALVLYEEAQKNKDENVLEQSVITFIRQLDLEAQLIIVGNNETAGHWFVDYVADKKQDPKWHYIYANCFDIWELLNKQTQDYITNFQTVNEVEFNRVFLGDIHASASDVVFPQFKRDKHYKRNYELKEKYITTLFIGIDHATTDDTFACVPVAVLDDGTCQTLEVLYNDPQETNRTLAPTEQCDLLEDFVNFLDKKYGIERNMLNVYLSVDSGAAPFIAQLKHLKKTSRNKGIWKQIDVKSFTKKKGDNLGIIKNAFAYDVLTILNEGGKQYDGRLNLHRLAKEIEKQRWKGRGSSKKSDLDPKIPNDLIDALEYGLIPFYSNCYNLSFPIRVRDYKQSAHVDDIMKFANS